MQPQLILTGANEKMLGPRNGVPDFTAKVEGSPNCAKAGWYRTAVAERLVLPEVQAAQTPLAWRMF